MSVRARSRPDVRTPLVVGGVLAAATLLVAIRDPHEGGYPICPMLALTGHACAGCGGLRAAHDLATGDVAGAWAMNPLLTILMPLAAVAWVVWLVRAATGRPAWDPPGWLWVAGAAVVVGFSVLRNVPGLQAALGPG